MTLTPIEERVLARLERDSLVELTAELVRYASLGGEESAIQDRVAEELDASGCEVDRWELDFAALSGHPGFSMDRVWWARSAPVRAGHCS